MKENKKLLKKLKKTSIKDEARIGPLSGLRDKDSGRVVLNGLGPDLYQVAEGLKS